MLSNPIYSAIAASVLLGISLVPWNYVIASTRQPGWFFVMLGATFVLSGLLQMRFQTEPPVLNKQIELAGVLTCVLYVAAITLLVVTFRNTTPEKLPIVSAILAAFILPGIVVNSIANRTMPSAVELSLIVVIIAGCVGISLAGEH